MCGPRLTRWFVGLAVVWLAGRPLIARSAERLEIRADAGALSLVRDWSDEFQRLHQAAAHIESLEASRWDDLLAAENWHLAVHTTKPSAGKLAPREFVVGYFAVALVTHERHRLRQLALEEIKGIFSGRLSKWEEIPKSGLRGPIEIFTPALSSMAAHVMARNAMSGVPFDARLRDFSAPIVRQMPTNEAVVGAVLTTERSIGFVLIAPPFKLDPRARLVPVARDADSPGVLPSTKSLWDGEYPLARELRIAQHAQAPTLAGEWRDFLQSKEAASVAAKHGLSAEYEPLQDAVAKRLAAARAGQGQRIAAAGDKSAKELLQALSQEFVAAETAIQVQYASGTELDTIRRFVQGDAELMLLDGPWSDEAATRFAADWAFLKPRSTIVGRQSIALVVHPSNPLDRLSLNQAQSIYSGQIRDWWTLTEGNTAIHRYGLPSNDEASKRFFELLYEGARPASPAKAASCETVSELIKSVAEDPQGLAAVNLADVSADQRKSIRIVPLATGSGPPRAPSDVDYRLARTLTLYVSPRASAAAVRFAEYVASGGADKSLEKLGLLPARPTLSGDDVHLRNSVRRGGDGP